MPAYAVKVSEENMSAIASEAGRGFDKEIARQWLKDHEAGIFLRDDSSPLDCEFFEVSVFAEMYMYERGNEDALFRRVIKI